MVELKLLLLLLVANGTPVLLQALLGSRYDFPVDGHLRGPDGHPLLGPSKTFRGLLGSLLVTPVCALAIGLPWWVGGLVGAGAMIGDLLSSFVKRRLGMTSSSRALGLDQIPESLLPLWLCQEPLGLDWSMVGSLVGTFFILELLLSRVLYRLHIRREPY